MGREAEVKAICKSMVRCKREGIPYEIMLGICFDGYFFRAPYRWNGGEAAPAFVPAWREDLSDIYNEIHPSGPVPDEP